MQLNISADLLLSLICLGNEVANDERRALDLYKREGAIDCAVCCAKSLREVKKTLREARRALRVDRSKTEDRSQERSASDLLLRLVANFPGFILEPNDVNGGDVIEWLSAELFQLSTDGPSWGKCLVQWAENGSQCQGCGEWTKNCEC